MGYPLTAWTQGNNVKDAAHLIQEFDDLYGVDYNLVNGKIHANFYGNASGDPYLSGTDFSYGWLKIKGKIYRSIKLNYDIYNQEVISEYNSNLIGTQRYVIPDAYLEGFEINGRVFRKIKIGDNRERIYEIISQGNYTILFTHNKNYTVSTIAQSRNYQFSEEILRMYMVTDNELQRFKNNRQFRKLFPEEMQDDVRLILKKKRINIKRSPVILIKKMMDGINQL